MDNWPAFLTGCCYIYFCFIFYYVYCLSYFFMLTFIRKVFLLFFLNLEDENEKFSEEGFAGSQSSCTGLS